MLTNEDLSKFQKYEEISKIRPSAGENSDEFLLRINTLIRYNSLSEYQRAHHLATKHLQTAIQMKNPDHLRTLEAGLAVQKNPEEWKKFNEPDQLLIKDILITKHQLLEKIKKDKISKNNVIKTGITFLDNVAKSSVPKIGLDIIASLFGDSTYDNAPSGYGFKEIKNLDKLDPKNFLDDKFPLNHDGLQYIVSRIADSRKECETIFKQYNFNIKSLDPLIQDDLEKLIADFKEHKKYEKIYNEKLKLEQQFKYAQNFGANVTQLGNMIKNPDLSTIGTFVQGTASIGMQIAEITGKLPGIAVPTGIGLLLPGANIVLSAATLLLALNSDQDEAQEQIMAALDVISKQITSLHKEINLRFDQIDKQLIQILNTNIAQWKHVQSTLTNDFNHLKKSLTIIFQQHNDDIRILESKMEKGLITIRTDRLKEKLTELKSYVSGNLSESDDAKKELIKLTEIIETDWLIHGAKLLDDMFNNSWQSFSDEKNQEKALHHIANISDYILVRDPDLYLGFLARFAKEHLGIPGMPSALPNLELFDQGLKQCLAGRLCLHQRHQYHKFDIHRRQLNALKQIPKNVITFVDKLTFYRESLFKKMGEMYIGALNTAEEKFLQITKNKYQAQLEGQTKSLTRLSISTIAPEIKDHPELGIHHFIKILNDNKIKFPAVLVDAEACHLPVLNVSYQGSRTEPRAGQGPGGDWHYPTYRIPSQPIYNCMVYLKRDNKSVCRITFETILPTTEWQLYGKGACRSDIDTIGPYISNQRSIPHKVMFGDHWSKSTYKDKTIQFNPDLQTILQELTPKLVSEIVEKRFLEAKRGDVESTNFIKKFVVDEEIQFKCIEEQFKAAQALMVAYGNLLGIPEKLLSQLKMDLKILNLNMLVNDPTLFVSQRLLVDPLVQTLSKQEISSSTTKLKAIGMLNRINAFEKYEQRYVLSHELSSSHLKKGRTSFFSHTDDLSLGAVSPVRIALNSKL